MEVDILSPVKDQLGGFLIRVITRGFHVARPGVSHLESTTRSPRLLERCVSSDAEEFLIVTEQGEPSYTMLYSVVLLCCCLCVGDGPSKGQIGHISVVRRPGRVFPGSGFFTQPHPA